MDDVTIGSLFAGVGGIDIGIEEVLPGARVIWQAESDPHALAVLERWWPGTARYRDVRDVDARAPRPTVVCGGFPCQDISTAGKGAGIDGERSRLWYEFARVVRDLRPDIVFVENSAALLGRGLDRVLGDLAALGFDAEWETFRAADVGAPHLRDRCFILAYTDRERVRQLAERHQRDWRGERAAERGDAEPLDDRAELADASGAGRGPAAVTVERGRGSSALRPGEAEPDGRSGDAARPVADAHGGDGNGRQREPGRRSAGGTSARGDGEGRDGSALADAHEPGRKGTAGRRLRAAGGAGAAGRGPRDMSLAELAELADPDGGGRREGGVELPARQPVAAQGGEELADTDRQGLSRADAGGEFGGLAAAELCGDAHHVADADGRGREGLGLAQPGRIGGAPGREPDGRRHVRYVHRFPPGPAAITGWDGPQPAIRRGDDGVPGRSHRLRLLGNACVPQQAALAFRLLLDRVTED